MLAKQIMHLLDRQQVLVTRNDELEAQARSTRDRCVASDQEAARAREETSHLQRALVQAQGTHSELVQQLSQMTRLLMQEQQRVSALNYELATRWASSWQTTQSSTAPAVIYTGAAPTSSYTTGTVYYPTQGGAGGGAVEGAPVQDQ